MAEDRSLVLVFVQHLCTVFLEGRRDGVRLISFEKQQVMAGAHFMESVVHMELLRYTYYFAEIAVDADHDGNIYECRKRGFESLESNPDFLQNTVRKGSYGEDWSLRKVLRRFIWHDRIHARAMYRMAIKVFGAESIVNPFYFFDEGVLT